VFVHISALERAGIHQLNDGQAVRSMSNATATVVNRQRTSPSPECRPDKS